MSITLPSVENDPVVVRIRERIESMQRQGLTPDDYEMKQAIDVFHQAVDEALSTPTHHNKIRRGELQGNDNLDCFLGHGSSSHISTRQARKQIISNQLGIDHIGGRSAATEKADRLLPGNAGRGSMTDTSKILDESGEYNEDFEEQSLQQHPVATCSDPRAASPAAWLQPMNAKPPVANTGVRAETELAAVGAGEGRKESGSGISPQVGGGAGTPTTYPITSARSETGTDGSLYTNFLDVGDWTNRSPTTFGEGEAGMEKNRGKNGVDSGDEGTLLQATCTDSEEHLMGYNPFREIDLGPNIDDAGIMDAESVHSRRKMLQQTHKQKNQQQRQQASDGRIADTSSDPNAQIRGHLDRERSLTSLISYAEDFETESCPAPSTKRKQGGGNEGRGSGARRGSAESRDSKVSRGSKVSAGSQSAIGNATIGTEDERMMGGFCFSASELSGSVMSAHAEQPSTQPHAQPSRLGLGEESVQEDRDSAPTAAVGIAFQGVSDECAADNRKKREGALPFSPAEGTTTRRSSGAGEVRETGEGRVRGDQVDSATVGTEDDCMMGGFCFGASELSGSVVSAQPGQRYASSLADPTQAHSEPQTQTQRDPQSAAGLERLQQKLASRNTDGLNETVCATEWDVRVYGKQQGDMSREQSSGQNRIVDSSAANGNNFSEDNFRFVPNPLISLSRYPSFGQPPSDSGEAPSSPAPVFDNTGRDSEQSKQSLLVSEAQRRGQEQGQQRGYVRAQSAGRRLSEVGITLDDSSVTPLFCAAGGASSAGDAAGDAEDEREWEDSHSAAAAVVQEDEEVEEVHIRKDEETDEIEEVDEEEPGVEGETSEVSEEGEELEIEEESLLAAIVSAAARERSEEIAPEVPDEDQDDDEIHEQQTQVEAQQRRIDVQRRAFEGHDSERKSDGGHKQEERYDRERDTDEARKESHPRCDAEYTTDYLHRCSIHYPRLASIEPAVDPFVGTEVDGEAERVEVAELETAGEVKLQGIKAGMAHAATPSAIEGGGVQTGAGRKRSTVTIKYIDDQHSRNASAYEKAAQAASIGYSHLSAHSYHPASSADPSSQSHVHMQQQHLYGAALGLQLNLDAAPSSEMDAEEWLLLHKQRSTGGGDARKERRVSSVEESEERERNADSVSVGVAERSGEPLQLSLLAKNDASMQQAFSRNAQLSPQLQQSAQSMEAENCTASTSTSVSPSASSSALIPSMVRQDAIYRRASEFGGRVVQSRYVPHRSDAILRAYNQHLVDERFAAAAAKVVFKDEQREQRQQQQRLLQEQDRDSTRGRSSSDLHVAVASKSVGRDSGGVRAGVLSASGDSDSGDWWANLNGLSGRRRRILAMTNPDATGGSKIPELSTPVISPHPHTAHVNKNGHNRHSHFSYGQMQKETGQQFVSQLDTTFEGAPPGSASVVVVTAATAVSAPEQAGSRPVREEHISIPRSPIQREVDQLTREMGDYIYNDTDFDDADAEDVHGLPGQEIHKGKRREEEAQRGGGNNIQGDQADRAGAARSYPLSPRHSGFSAVSGVTAGSGISGFSEYISSGAAAHTGLVRAIGEGMNGGRGVSSRNVVDGTTVGQLGQLGKEGKDRKDRRRGEKDAEDAADVRIAELTAIIGELAASNQALVKALNKIMADEREGGRFTEKSSGHERGLLGQEGGGEGERGRRGGASEAKRAPGRRSGSPEQRKQARSASPLRSRGRNVYGSPYNTRASPRSPSTAAGRERSRGRLRAATSNREAVSSARAATAPLSSSFMQRHVSPFVALPTGAPSVRDTGHPLLPRGALALPSPSPRSVPSSPRSPLRGSAHHSNNDRNAVATNISYPMKQSNQGRVFSIARSVAPEHRAASAPTSTPTPILSTTAAASSRGRASLDVSESPSSSFPLSRAQQHQYQREIEHAQPISWFVPDNVVISSHSPLQPHEQPQPLAQLQLQLQRDGEMQSAFNSHSVDASYIRPATLLEESWSTLGGAAHTQTLPHTLAHTLAPAQALHGPNALTYQDAVDADESGVQIGQGLSTEPGSSSWPPHTLLKQPPHKQHGISSAVAVGAEAGGGFGVRAMPAGPDAGVSWRLRGGGERVVVRGGVGAVTGAASVVDSVVDGALTRIYPLSANASSSPNHAEQHRLQRERREGEGGEAKEEERGERGDRGGVSGSITATALSFPSEFVTPHSSIAGNTSGGNTCTYTLPANPHAHSHSLSNSFSRSHSLFNSADISLTSGLGPGVGESERERERHVGYPSREREENMCIGAGVSGVSDRYTWERGSHVSYVDSQQQRTPLEQEQDQFCGREREDVGCRRQIGESGWSVGDDLTLASARSEEISASANLRRRQRLTAHMIAEADAFIHKVMMGQQGKQQREQQQHQHQHEQKEQRTAIALPSASIGMSSSNIVGPSPRQQAHKLRSRSDSSALNPQDGSARNQEYLTTVVHGLFVPQPPSGAALASALKSSRPSTASAGRPGTGSRSHSANGRSRGAAGRDRPHVRSTEAKAAAASAWAVAVGADHSTDDRLQRVRGSAGYGYSFDSRAAYDPDAYISRRSICSEGEEGEQPSLQHRLLSVGSFLSNMHKRALLQPNSSARSNGRASRVESSSQRIKGAAVPGPAAWLKIRVGRHISSGGGIYKGDIYAPSRTVLQTDPPRSTVGNISFDRSDPVPHPQPPNPHPPASSPHQSFTQPHSIHRARYTRPSSGPQQAESDMQGPLAVHGKRSNDQRQKAGRCLHSKDWDSGGADCVTDPRLVPHTQSTDAPAYLKTAVALAAAYGHAPPFTAVDQHHHHDTALVGIEGGGGGGTGRGRDSGDGAHNRAKTRESGAAGERLLWGDAVRAGSMQQHHIHIPHTAKQQWQQQSQSYSPGLRGVPVQFGRFTGEDAGRSTAVGTGRGKDGGLREVVGYDFSLQGFRKGEQ